MIRLRTGLPAVAIVAAVFALAAMQGAGAQERRNDGAPPVAAVEIDNFQFSASALEVAVGTKVTWTNKDDVPHVVASSTRLFKSPPLDTDESFSYTFESAGTFEYFCAMHPQMTGKVVVR